VQGEPKGSSIVSSGILPLQLDDYHCRVVGEADKIVEEKYYTQEGDYS